MFNSCRTCFSRFSVVASDAIAFRERENASTRLANPTHNVLSFIIQPFLIESSFQFCWKIKPGPFAASPGTRIAGPANSLNPAIASGGPHLDHDPNAGHSRGARSNAGDIRACSKPAAAQSKRAAGPKAAHTRHTAAAQHRDRPARDERKREFPPLLQPQLQHWPGERLRKPEPPRLPT